MLKLTLQFFAIVVLVERAYSWGGRFNRFSPEMLSNMGYGGYGNNRHSPQVIIIVLFHFFFLNFSHIFIIPNEDIVSLISIDQIIFEARHHP